MINSATCVEKTQHLTNSPRKPCDSRGGDASRIS